jgi:hypothetical protein
MDELQKQKLRVLVTRFANQYNILYDIQGKERPSLNKRYYIQLQEYGITERIILTIGQIIVRIEDDNNYYDYRTINEISISSEHLREPEKIIEVLIQKCKTFLPNIEFYEKLEN